MSSSESDSHSVQDPEYETLSQKIIVEVQKRPALYDITSRQHSDRIVKNRQWEEVYENVISNWGMLSEDDKKKKGNTIQKKWKNMRDCFAKELALQQGKSGQGAIKKKKYVHFDSLLFLMPSLKKRKTSGAPSSDSENIPPLNNNTQQTCRTKTSQGSQNQNNTNTEYEQKLLDFLETNKETHDYDEDISFSRMIVPMLRKLNDEQKHFAKVEILNTLQKAKSYPFLPPFHVQDSRSRMAYMQTPSPQSSYSYSVHSPSPSPTLPVMSPVSSQIPPTPAATKKPKIIRQEIISTGNQQYTPISRGPANHTINLPLEPASPSPMLPVMSPVSSQIPPTPAATKKPKIIRQEIISTGNQQYTPISRGPANHTINLPLEPASPSPMLPVMSPVSSQIPPTPAATKKPKIIRQEIISTGNQQYTPISRGPANHTINLPLEPASPSPTLPVMSPVSSQIPPTPAATKKPKIIRQEIISTGNQQYTPISRGPANHTINLPLEPASPSPTLPVMSPVSSQIPPTPAATKKPKIIRQEIISTGNQQYTPISRGPANHTINLPLEPATELTSQTDEQRAFISDEYQQDLSTRESLDSELTAAAYLSQFFKL